MDRKKFLKNGLIGMGSIVAIPTVLSSCSNDDNNDNDPDACAPSPSETAGPFPIKTPADLVRENIVGNKTGVPLLINFTIQNTNSNCTPLQNAIVDIWQCDAKGNYSEYSGQLDGNFTSEHFLRGRQTTDTNGKASFISIYPGWYPGRTPHLHVEIKSNSGSSLLITQVSFPENVSNTVYATTEYKGIADTNNLNDGIVGAANLADSVTGDTTNGYTLTKIIKVTG
ncbi:intradiol ring-cleavage dioxygenase [Flavivirga spongiicola]|uniref:Intradiol ring-cleavage dioxygenase n=1 Tax=Flavivirga spongiicola TaxID=421621 RepID=A0ABU7XVM4_9FLAO|nr:intradiol ring-cleavage dioxygenase [Flavivirga sp. MEBiC05379]MDO5978903.1 intradiol ring-cleavage dioxygenase [Flavivirga sp. MEBiC05379]